MTPYVAFKNVFFNPDGKPVLENISAIFNAGQLTTLIGPNGGGKSTILKLILGIEKPTSGLVRIHHGLKIGYMPQKIAIDPNMPLTVEWFLNCPGCLEEVGARHLAPLKMSTLSGGEMQRVLLAYALKNKPELLLLDEPTQGLDITGEQQIYELIFNYQKRSGCCIIMASHDLNFVLARSDQVLCVNGHLCCQGHPDQVRHQKTYKDLFEKVPYTHHHDHIHTLEGEVCACGK